MLASERGLAAWAVLAFLLSTTPASGQEGDLDEIQRLLESRRAGRQAANGAAAEGEVEVQLTDQERSQILDKPKVAEETTARLHNAREAGNPHIRRGLLLKTITDDPTRSHVDAEAHRREMVALVEKPDRISGVKSASSYFKPVRAPSPTPRAATAPPSAGDAPVSSWGLLIPGVLLLGLAALLTAVIRARRGARMGF